MNVRIPIRLPSAANLREDWRVRHRRVKLQRTATALYLGGGPRPALPVTVTLTRIAPRALDGDNLQGAFKGVRDEVAKWLGVADNHPDITWVYGQERRGVGEYAIDINIVPRA